MMKLFINIILLFFTVLGFTQNTYTVDNKSNAIADFDNLQLAIDSVPIGSTLLVHSGSYGDIQIDKKIYIRGTGFFLSENPNTQSILSSSTVDDIIFLLGSDQSTIEGLNMTGDISSSVLVMGVSILRNRIEYIKFSGLQNGLVHSNFIYSNRSNGFTQYESIHAGPGTTIIGNIIHSYITGSNLSISNNKVSQVTWSKVFNSLVKNNIWSSSSSFPNFEDENNTNTYRNNIYYSSSITSNSIDSLGFGNILTGETLYIDSSDPNYSSDGRYILKTGSVAINAGLNGEDIGPFGGGYRLSGIPDIPNIYQFNVPSLGYSNSTGIDVNIKVKSNN